MDTLIVMDHVIGLADNSNDFANFLIVARKFGYSCVYIFHIIYPEKANCEMNLSQTKIINIFPAWIEQSIALKIISDNCSCTKPCPTFQIKNYGLIEFLWNFHPKKKKII